MKNLKISIFMIALLTSCKKDESKVRETQFDVSQSEASIVANLLYQKLNNDVAGKISNTRIFTTDGINLLYLFQYDYKNSLLISGDRRVYPLLGYSLNGEYKDIADTASPAFNELIEGYKEQLFNLKKSKLTVAIDSNATELWGQLLTINPIFNILFPCGNKPPLLCTKWGQQGYYNDMCPNPCNRQEQMLAGCVPVTIAQILKYHQDNTASSGIINYLNAPATTACTNENNVIQDISYIHNYSNIICALDNISTLSQKNDIARLIYYAGLSTRASYGYSGTGSTIINASNAFHNHWGFNNTNYYYRSSYNDDAWSSLLKNKLNQNIPIYYRGMITSDTGGHAWVCDGYNCLDFRFNSSNYRSEFFNMNWGWNGQHNGLFRISQLAPGSYSFNQNNMAFMPTP